MVLESCSCQEEEQRVSTASAHDGCDERGDGFLPLTGAPERPHRKDADVRKDEEDIVVRTGYEVEPVAEDRIVDEPEEMREEDQSGAQCNQPVPPVPKRVDH